MYMRVRSYIIFVLFSFCTFITFPEGFAPDTLVRLGKKLGWQTIAKTVVASKRFIFKDPVLSCNVGSGRWEAKKVRGGTTVDTDCYIKLWFNGCKACDVMCTPDQAFYSVSTKKWVYAYQLKIGDYLLAEDNNRVRVSDIELVKKPMRMYTINVKHNNTFVVGKHKVLAHNMDIPCDGVAWIGSAVAGVAGLMLEIAEGTLILSTPIAGPAGLVAAAGIGYIAGSLLAEACNKTSHYRTKSCAEKIDETIANMKEAVGTEKKSTPSKDSETNDETRKKAKIAQHNTSGEENEHLKPLYGCGTETNTSDHLIKPGTCGLGLNDKDKHIIKDCGLGLPDLPIKYGCGPDIEKPTQPIETRPCNYSQRRGLPSLDNTTDTPAQTDSPQPPDDAVTEQAQAERAALDTETTVDDNTNGNAPTTAASESEVIVTDRGEGIAAIETELENANIIIINVLSTQEASARIEKDAQLRIVKEGKHPIAISKDEQEGFRTKHKYRVIEETGETCRVVRPKKETLRDAWAEAKYKEIREWTDDVEKIAENTGISKEQIQRIKDHLFYDDEHILDDRIGQFDADAEIAAAWDRLSKGDYIANDIHLLEHELFELMYENAYATDYRTAHKAAEDSGREWNYPRFVEEEKCT